MRFREEVLGKVFTCVTVVVLLVIIILEAWDIRGERARAQGAVSEQDVLRAELEEALRAGDALERQVESLEAFQKQWAPYASYVESQEMEALRNNLLGRPSLVPQEVSDGLSLSLTEDGAASPWPEGTKPSYSFAEPDRDPVFLPYGTQLGPNASCLVYTVAKEKTTGSLVSLLFSLRLKASGQPETDEMAQIAWHCIAYDCGGGWVSIPSGEAQENP